MILPPRWLSCLLASTLPGSIWKSEMLEICLEKPVFNLSVEQEYQHDQMVIENIFRLVSSITQWQIGSITVFLDFCRFHSFRGEALSLRSHLYQHCGSSATDEGNRCQHFSPGSPRRWLNVDLCSVLLLPLFWQQRVSDDRLAVPLLRGQHCRLERPGCDHRGALPYG